MSSVILELQRDALNEAVSITFLVRKAMVIARKLGIKEFQDWIDKELKGYSHEDKIPNYREITGEVKLWNPYRGWIPMAFEDSEAALRLSTRKSTQTIAELENLVNNKSEDAMFSMPFSHEVQRWLSSSFPMQTEVTLFTHRSSIIKILDTVRTIILNWALKLEEEGILGEDMSFTSEEKTQAEKQPNNITNFYGPVHNPQLQQEANHAVQISQTSTVDLEAASKFIEHFQREIINGKLSADSKAEAESEIDTIKAQIKSPRPKMSIIKEGLQSLKRILEGTGGSVGGHILVELGKLLG